VNLLLDILTGAGLAAAVGVRPFLPALVAAALAAGDVLIDFDGTEFSFLESPGWMGALAAALIVAQVLQLRGMDGINGPLGSALAGIGIGLGALLFAATLDDGSDVWWPGLIGGAACAALASAATRSLLTRTSARLDTAARRALPLYAVMAGMLLAALAVVAPPVSVLALAFFAFLLRGSGRREGEKYAGLRILR
jgi:hypothetical protein